MLIIYLILKLLLAGLICFALPKNNTKIAAYLAIMASIIGIVFSTILCINKNEGETFYEKFEWIKELGANFEIQISGLSALLCLLTSICFLLITLSTINKNIDKPNTFYGLMLFSMAGLLGVFVAADALLFYIFWELALIPVYFLCSMWGGENRIKVSFKFFIYTFVGSLLMLVALIYMYNHTADHSFSWNSFAQLQNTIPLATQKILYLLLFIAFAIKMPIFPLHTWQPDTYIQTLTPVTMVLSAVMVKMGLFAVTRWLNPIFPVVGELYSVYITLLCVIGIVYASLLAMVQSNVKKLVAYSSIAHIGLMAAALYSFKDIGAIGAGVQMFSHGINIIGLWVLIYFIERKLKTQNLNEMGGIASLNPTFTIFLVVIVLANVALPLTNGFIGEFMMFNGIFNSKMYMHLSGNLNIIFTVLAGLAIILGAVYSLSMVQKIAFGVVKDSSLTTENMKLSSGEFIALSIITALILIFGFYPQPIIDLVNLDLIKI